jgi:hypothetical protein
MDGGSWADINAPIEKVFAIVADLELLPQWHSDVQVAECLERDPAGRVEVLLLVLETIVRRTEAALRIDYVEPTSVSWTMDRGDVRAFTGSWTLLTLPDGGTRASYAVSIDFGRKLGLLLRGPGGRAIGDAAVSSLPRKLKAFVEQSTAVPTCR